MFRRTVLIAAALLTLTGWPLAAAHAQPSEYEVKAVFLFNFSQFVDWPPRAFAGSQEPLIIGVLGEDPFGAVLDEVVHEESVNGRPLVARRFDDVSQVDHCHILFVASSQRARLDEILRQLHGRPILTVADFDGFAEQGGMVRFATVAGRIRLHINLDAARAENLTISSKLLRPAQIVATVESGRR